MVTMVTKLIFGDKCRICDICSIGEDGERVKSGYDDFDLCDDCGEIWYELLDIKENIAQLRKLGATVSGNVNYKGFTLLEDGNDEQ